MAKVIQLKDNENENLYPTTNPAYIQFGISDNFGQAVAAGTMTINNWVVASQNGSKIIPTSTGFTIGAGVSRIKISVDLWLRYFASTTLGAFKLLKNGTAIKSIQRNYASTQEGQDILNIGSVCVSVSQGDVFRVDWNKNYVSDYLYPTDTTRGLSTAMLVEVIN